MFTCNPVQNDPTKIVLNLTNEVGEALVSGKVIPCQIILSKTEDGKFKIINSPLTVIFLLYYLSILI